MTVGITYEASYVMDNSSRDVCWHGVCRIYLYYQDNRLSAYRSQLSAALGKIYREKFGDLNPPKE